ncbi:hypothetical protein BYT27DRAFT_6483767 [Phlegmacium glaucopus]|nr:hypothetical protein BYT27DRAFT_6483767 [Phlegmacium glaucopus]
MPDMFKNARDLAFYGGTFNNANNVNYYTSTPAPASTSEGIRILHRNIESGAFHDSGERFDAPKCHPNTRKAVIERIMRWVRDANPEDVLWLYGSAGVGKSALGQKIAEMCADPKLGLLVASFFFARTIPSRNNEKRLISSIAYQLAQNIPETQTYIESAVRGDPEIINKSLEAQIKTLIIQPLENACATVRRSVAREWPRLIIIDGLDECRGPAIQCSIIRLLSKALHDIQFPLILLIASRPEPHIRSAFNLLDNCLDIHLDDSHESDADIKAFFISRFEEIKQKHPLAKFIPSSWPSAEIIDRLVRKSSGQFIYASTVMKNLESPHDHPRRLLDDMMGSADADIPYKEVDTLYSQIFSRVRAQHLATTLKIFGFLFFRCPDATAEPVTPEFMAHLIGLKEEDVHLCLSELHSILYVPPPGHQSSGLGSEIKIIHASLEDYLVDKLRSEKYYLDERAFHTDIAGQGACQIRTLSMNTMGQNHQGLEGLSRLQKYLTSSFIYHCKRASTVSSGLKNDLMHVRDLRPWFKICPAVIKQFVSLCTWLSKVDTEGDELSSHMELLWNEYCDSGTTTFT